MSLRDFSGESRSDPAKVAVGFNPRFHGREDIGVAARRLMGRPRIALAGFTRRSAAPEVWPVFFGAAVCQIVRFPLVAWLGGGQEGGWKVKFEFPRGRDRCCFGHEVGEVVRSENPGRGFIGWQSHGEKIQSYH